MKTITDKEFAPLITSSQKLVMVDLSARAWCQPCKLLHPKLEELSQENTDFVDIVEIDIDENQETAAKYHVRGVPTVLFFKNGQHVDTFVGNQSKDSIQALIDKHK